jgi:hypothetical protein
MLTIATAGSSPCPPKAAQAQGRPLPPAMRGDRRDAFDRRIPAGHTHRRTPSRGVGSAKPVAAGRRPSDPTLLLAH